MNDTFRGDTPHLITCIQALLSLDAAGALVPHGIGGHARDLLESAAARLAPRSEEVDMCRQHGEALQRIGSALGLAAGTDVHRAAVPAIEDLKVRAGVVDEPVQWGDPGTVGMFVRQLQTIDPATPINAAFHADYRGNRVAMIKPVTLSRERVSGRFIRQGDETVPYSMVVWAQQDELAPPNAKPAMPEGWHVTVGRYDDTRLTISDTGYGGAVLTDEDDHLIAGAARHLLSFIGYGLPPSAFDPEDSAPVPYCAPDGTCSCAKFADDPATCDRAKASSEAHRRIYDLLLGDDGQALKEARKYLERSAPELAARLATGGEAACTCCGCGGCKTCLGGRNRCAKHSPLAASPSGADEHVWLKCDGCGKDMRGHDRMGHCAARSSAPEEPDMRAVCEALGFDPTNHHNAAKCPYCRPAEPPAAAGAAQAVAWCSRCGCGNDAAGFAHLPACPTLQPDDTPLETGEGEAQ